jgi:hypothetical protein
MPAQRLALKRVDLAVADVDTFELPAVKTEKLRADEITRDIVRTRFVSKCIKITYLSSSEKEESGESEGGSELEGGVERCPAWMCNVQ